MPIRLRNILKEKIGLDKLLNLIETEFIVYRKPLYRGTDRRINKYDIRKPRTNRIPLSTNQNIQDIVEVVTDVFYSDHPNRARSTFATAFEKEAATYGTNVLYVFPHKTAKIKFYPSDTYQGYFSLMSGYYESVYAELFENRDAYDDFFDELGNQKIEKFIKPFFEFVVGREGKSKLKKLFEDFSSFDSLQNQLQMMIKRIRETENSEYMIPFKNVRKILELAETYFEDASDKFISGDSEMVIEGKYLAVDVDFLEEKKVWGR